MTHSPHPTDALSVLQMQIEALLFAAEAPLDVKEIREYLGGIALSQVLLAIEGLRQDYQKRAFFLAEIGQKYQLRTRPQYAELLQKALKERPRHLSKSSLETLAIIAYQQPVTRAEINAIRGVDCSSLVSALKDKELVAVSGRRDTVGSPLEYRTTSRFLEVFGIKSMKELPSLRSLQMSPEQQEKIKTALADAAAPAWEAQPANAVTAEHLGLPSLPSDPERVHSNEVSTPAQ